MVQIFPVIHGAVHVHKVLEELEITTMDPGEAFGPTRSRDFGATNQLTSMLLCNHSLHEWVILVCLPDVVLQIIPGVVVYPFMNVYCP